MDRGMSVELWWNDADRRKTKCSNDSLSQYLFVHYKPYTNCIRKQSGISGVRRRLLTSRIPPQRLGSDSKEAHVEFVVDEMLLKSAVKRNVDKIKELFIKYYSILGCDSLNFYARTYKQESDKKI
jgi:hypothetical protein